jgi:hypothetical protein
MRFGSRSHESEPEKHHSKEAVERDRLVRRLRDLADRIDRAPLTRTNSVAAAVEPLVGAVERALGTKH